MSHDIGKIRKQKDGQPSGQGAEEFRRQAQQTIDASRLQHNPQATKKGTSSEIIQNFEEALRRRVEAFKQENVEWNESDMLPSVSPQEAIWKFTERMLISNIKSEKEITHFYRDKVKKDPKLDKSAKETYLSKIAEIGVNIDAVYCIPQVPESEGEYSRTELSTAKFLGANPDGKYRGKAISFYEARKKIPKAEDKARLSLQVTPSQATDVFAYVVSELVAKDPNVRAAKVASPYDIHRRNDSLIIYLCENNEEKALNIARGLRTKFSEEGCIGVSVPAGMKEMCLGIGYAENLSKENSHSKVIAAVVASSIDKYYEYVYTRRQGHESTEELFKTNFIPQSFVEYGINPEAPYKKRDSIPVDGPLRRDLPSSS